MRNLKVYKSSAGSGKTTTLVKEFLFLVISNPDKYNRILAITFTNKAADEMKQRIIEYLEILAVFDPAKGEQQEKYHILKQIVDALEESDRLKIPEINRRAEKVLKRILHNYSEFAVSTIDSLMHRVIRSFAFDLRLPQNFEVVLESDDLVEKAVDLLLDDIGQDKEFGDFIIDFLEKRVDDDKAWRIDNLLIEFAGILHREDGIKYIRKLDDISLQRYIDMDKNLLKHINAFEKFLFDIGCEAVKLMKDIPPKAFFRGTSGIYKYFERFYKKDFSQPAGNSYSYKFVYEDKYFASKLTADEKSAVENVAPDLVRFYKRIEEHRDKHEEKYYLYLLIRQNLFSLAVLQKIEKYLEDVKSENDLVHISEFNKRIAEVVKQPVPFIYERLGEKYENYFIDEFQDTSVLQWNNLLPLVENGLANGNLSLIVGDGKQAIYRWRGGEVEQFSSLPEIYDKSGVADPVGTGRALASNYDFKSLNDNYRSRENIVNFNNEFFSFVKKGYFSDDLKKVYVEHKQNSKKNGGAVSVTFVEKEGVREELHLNALITKIDDIVTQGYKHSDIAVLCRSNKEGVLISKKLLEVGIDVISAESLLLSSSPDLHFLMAVLSLLNNPDDRNSKVEVINYLHRKGDDYFTNIHSALKKFISKYKNSGNYSAEGLLKSVNINT
ncbi:MAG: UvrD-helicase domain-containing protein, partial [Bacteroidota bacterium]|nr:UvrD-helicase domain-containing protein [Bacteroidota bacterium]